MKAAEKLFEKIEIQHQKDILVLEEKWKKQCKKVEVRIRREYEEKLGRIKKILDTI